VLPGKKNALQSEKKVLSF